MGRCSCRQWEYVIDASHQADNSAGNAGAVYVFVRSGTTWTQQAYLKASNTGVSDQFGYSVSLSGDTLAVGAFSEDSAATGVNGNQAAERRLDLPSDDNYIAPSLAA